MDKMEEIKCARLAEQIAGITKISNAVKNAIAKTPRSIFAPDFADAFSLEAHPIDGQQWISSPLTVAKMSQALNAQGCDSVLEIGCGSGYQAAVLALLARRVFSIERIESLATSAKARFKALEINNVFVRFDDGNVGWPSYAPFERIILSCACNSVPEALFKQLSDNGILVAPVNHGGTQYITKYEKRAQSISSTRLEPCEFVPLLNGRA